MPLLLPMAVGALSGAHASIWGMYKDAPHEGFGWTKLFRSLWIGALVGPIVAWVLSLDPARAGDFVLLWGTGYAAERGVAELYKTFLRAEDQSKYFIPMQFAVVGRPVASPWLRALAGAAYAVGIGGALLAVARLAPPTAGVFTLVALGSVGGWISAFGGAWKDAPFEGFETLKFFRSPLLAAGFAALLTRVSDRPLVVLLAALGLTVAATETYKTFFRPSVPRGKFTGKPVLFPEQLIRRNRFVPIFVLIWLVPIVAFTMAMLSADQSARVFAFIAMTAWCHGPLSPILPAAFEPMLLEAGLHFPPFSLALTGASVATGAEWANYHLYGKLVRTRRGELLLATRPALRLRSWFDRQPFLTTWVVIFTPAPDWGARLLAVHARYSPARYLGAVFLARVPRFWIIASMGAVIRPNGWVLGALVVAPIVVGLAARWRRRWVARTSGAPSGDRNLEVSPFPAPAVLP